MHLVLELCSGGDLYSRDPYDEEQACNIVYSIVDAVSYMHGKGITHRDLKYENIMFSNPVTYSVKLIDFGLSKKYAMQEHLHDTVGTVSFKFPFLGEMTLFSFTNSKPTLFID
jgi:serine/threonine protein kinase